MNPYDAGVLGSLKPLLGDLVMHPSVYNQIQNGKHTEVLHSFVNAEHYGEFRLIVDANVPPDRFLFIKANVTMEVMLVGLPSALPPEVVEAQEMREIEELRRQIMEQSNEL